MIHFEGYERRIPQVQQCLAKYGFASLEEVKAECDASGIDVREIVLNTQPNAFENAIWAISLGVAIACRTNAREITGIESALGEGLQTFCIPGSIAARREVGYGHARLASRLLDERTKCFCFLAGHESFAAASGALKIAANANKARTLPLRVILNGLGKEAAYMISRVNGFTYVHTAYDFDAGTLNIEWEKRFSDGISGDIRCYGADEVNEGVAIMKHEAVDVSITGNSTNPVRFQHPVAGIYYRYCQEIGHNYFSVASGGAVGNTLHPDNMWGGPSSYGLTDSMGRMHCSAIFAGSSSVPAHVEMMGFIGMGNNTLVGVMTAVMVALLQRT
ncbi:MAG: GGGtGRT protein [Mailhella sp.]|nr:GGGtGRT protein [Mailhella sp.]